MLAVIRHGDAGERARWQGDDRLRPLNRKGLEQAERLVAELASARFTRILSSGHVRCVQTVAPLAAARGLRVEESEALVEGAPLEDALALLLRLSGQDAALCTHGDVMAALCDHLVALRLVRPAEVTYQKGGTWLLGEQKGELKSARYLPAPR